MQLVIPMTGKGSRFFDAGYELPKPLISLRGRSLIERLLESFPSDWPTTFIINDDHRSFDFEAPLRKLRPKAQILWTSHSPLGPGKALQYALPFLDAQQPVFVSYCDYGQSWDPRRFEAFVRGSQCDAALVSYRGFHAHYLSPQTYAYSRVENDFVVEVKEKGSFTSDRENEFASTGGYYFRSAQILGEALDYQMRNELFAKGESYTSLSIQALLQMDPSAKVKVFECDYFFQWGTPQDLEEYAYWEACFEARLSTPRFTPSGEHQILMPMAGLGSRFQNVLPTPKAFVRWKQKAMFEHALDSLPPGSGHFFVAKNEHRESLLASSRVKNENVIWLSETPPGQALSTLAGLKQMNPQLPVLVSACDHGIVVDPALWDKLPSCADLAILSIRDFPGARRKPESFAYLRRGPLDVSSGLHQIQSVSVKRPISEQAHKDPLLVGSFWFRSGQLAIELIERLRYVPAQVRGELYLDSVVDLAVEQGLRVLDLPLRAYFNWGDPESLLEALYWEEYFGAQDLKTRKRFGGLEDAGV